MTTPSQRPAQPVATDAKYGNRVAVVVGGRSSIRYAPGSKPGGAGLGLSGQHIPDLAVTTGAGRALLRERGGLFRGEIGFCRQARNCLEHHVGPSRTSLDSTRPLTSRAIPPAGLPFRRCQSGTA